MLFKIGNSFTLLKKTETIREGYNAIPLEKFKTAASLGVEARTFVL